MNRIIALILLVTFIPGFTFAEEPAVSPEALLTRLYNEHGGKADPLSYPASKQLLQSYFSKPLLDLYLKDQVESAGQVGKLDFDPLYDAQDYQLSDFNLVSLSRKNGGALIAARFKNYSLGQEIIFSLQETEQGWRILDIKYKQGRTLLELLKE